MISSSLSIAAGQANEQTPCGRGGMSLQCVRRRCPRLRWRKAGLDGGGASPAVGEVFFGDWGSGKGGRKRRIVGGDGGGGGGTRGKVRLWRSLGLPGGAGSAFSYVASAAGAPDRILPDRGRRRGTGYFFGLRLRPARFWGRRWYTNLTSKPKKLSGSVLGAIWGAPVEMLLVIIHCTWLNFAGGQQIQRRLRTEDCQEGKDNSQDQQRKEMTVYYYHVGPIGPLNAS
jgi:hypothetical protein